MLDFHKSNNANTSDLLEKTLSEIYLAKYDIMVWMKDGEDGEEI